MKEADTAREEGMAEQVAVTEMGVVSEEMAADLEEVDWEAMEEAVGLEEGVAAEGASVLPDFLASEGWA